MGAFTSRQNAAVEEAEQIANHAYKYPPRSGNFFGSHFIMGGERFDTPQPESYLFGENVDLNFLGNRPTAFPYPPPAANEPTKTLKSLVNIRKESVRFVRLASEKKLESLPNKVLNGEQPDIDGQQAVPTCYNIEFTFDSDAKCAITIYYFCTEDVSPSGVTLTPRDGLISETYHYDKGINQYFSQTGHLFNPQLIPEDDFIYNPYKEQYPVAIHCVVEEGNEDCRQSHTTICVIDHHPETNSYVLRALKQKIFVDGLCYLLQEIYGIENKAINKSSVDEEIDDHGSECVICMSETRDTLILPCRHLCLCNSCADSLRYQANNCPICRAPFRALLQIRAVQKGVANSSHMLHQSTQSGANGEPAACDQHLPAGYIPVSLIEALNGPPQYVGRVRPLDSDMPDGNNHVSMLGMESGHKHGNTPHKTTTHRSSRSSKKKHANAITSNNHAHSMEMNTLSSGAGTALSVVEIAPTKQQNPSPTLAASLSEVGGQEKLQIINERAQAQKSLAKNQRHKITAEHLSKHQEVEENSEDEKLSPLLTPQGKLGSGHGKLVGAQSINSECISGSLETDEEDADETHTNTRAEGDEENESKSECDCAECECEQNNKTHCIVAGRKSVPLRSASVKHTQLTKTKSDANKHDICAMQVEELDYYNLKENSRAKSATSAIIAERGGSLKHSVSSFKNATNLMKKTLHKKSTSVGNMVGASTTNNIAASAHNKTDNKGNVSSLPDMLDSPLHGNTASTRSSSDSYSSSSSTKQLLSSTALTVATSTPTTTTTAASANVANIIVDDKTALQNAVNV